MPASPSPSCLTLRGYICDHNLPVRLEVFVIIRDHWHVAARPPSYQSEENGLRDTIHDVADKSREVELLAKNDHAKHDYNDHDGAEYLADLLVSDCRDCRIRDVADHQEREREHQEAQPEMPWQVSEECLVI